MMKMYKKIALSLISICIFNYSHACLNSYDDKVEGMEPDPTSITFESQAKRDEFYQNELEKFLKKYPKPKTVEEQNDYAVRLIYNGKYKKAIKILLEIEKSKPNLSNTAVNLGTAYELLGQNENAKFWIEKGLKINPSVHRGSEWIHLNILKAKLANADSKWIRENPILELDFGSGYFPKLSHDSNLKWDIDSIDRLAYQAKLQLRERRKFIFGHDLTMARLAYESANVEVLRGQMYEAKYRNGFKNEIADKLATVAIEHGLEKGKIEEKRLKMLLSDSFIYRFLLVILDFISKPFR